MVMYWEVSVRRSRAGLYSGGGDESCLGLRGLGRGWGSGFRAGLLGGRYRAVGIATIPKNQMEHEMDNSDRDMKGIRHSP